MFKERILNLTKRLYPKGRAFRVPFGGMLEKVHKGLAISENDAYADAVSVLDSILPDNDNFTAEDATNWERRLGLITVVGITLDERKLAISRKMQHPGTIKARQHYLFLERELQAAGFNVFVHENRIANPATSYISLGDFNLGDNNVGDKITSSNPFGVIPPEDYNPGAFDIIANYLDPALDANFLDKVFINSGEFNLGEVSLGDVFDLTGAYRSTFFIGGPIFGSIALISQARSTEFRQLVLKVKPVQTVGFSFLLFGSEDYGNDYGDDYNSQV